MKLIALILALAGLTMAAEPSVFPQMVSSNTLRAFMVVPPDWADHINLWIYYGDSRETTFRARLVYEEAGRPRVFTCTVERGEANVGLCRIPVEKISDIRLIRAELEHGTLQKAGEWKP